MPSPIALYKQAYSGLSRSSWYLSLVMFINRSGTMVIPFMTIYCIQRLHFTVAQAGIIMALFGAGSIAGAFIGGKVTDKIGFYDLQVFALISGGVFFILLGFQKTFLTVGACTFLLSLCNESFRPANSTAIAHYSSAENKTRSFSLNRLAVNLGWAFGGGLGGFLASVNYSLLFWVDGFTNVFAGVMLLVLMPRVKPDKIEKTQVKEVETVSAYRDYVYLAFIGITVLYASCFFQLFTMQPVFFKSVWHFNERFIGFLMAFNGIIITLVEMVLIHNLEGKREPLHYIALGTLLVGLGFACLNVFPAAAWGALLITLIITFGEMLCMPFMNSFWIARTTTNNRGEYAGLYTIAWSIAQIIAPSLGGLIILRNGYHTLWWVIGLSCATASAGFLLLNRFHNRIKG